MHLLEFQEQTRIQPIEQFADGTQVVGVGSQTRQAASQLQRLGHFGLHVALLAGARAFQLGLQAHLLALQLLEDRGDGLVLVLVLGQRQVGGGALQLAVDQGERRLLRRDGRVLAAVRGFLPNQFLQALLDLHPDPRRQQPLPGAGQHEPGGERPIDKVMGALGALALLVQAAQVTKGAAVGLAVHWPAAVHVESAAAQRVLGRVRRPRLAALRARPRVEGVDQPVVAVARDQRLEACRCQDQGRVGIANDLGLAVSAQVGVVQFAGAVRREAELVAHRPPAVGHQRRDHRVARDGDDGGLVPDAAGRMLDAAVGARPTGVRRRDAVLGQLGGDLGGWLGFQQGEDAADDRDLFVGARQPDDVVMSHADILAVEQLPHDRAVVLHQEAAVTVRRPAPDGVTEFGQLHLRVDQLLGQIAAELAGGLVVEQGTDQLADVGAAGLGQGRQGPVHEDQGEARLAEQVLQLDGVHRVVGPGHAVAARNKDVRDRLVGQGFLDQGVEAGAGEQIAGDAVVLEEVALHRAVAGDHLLDALRRAVE